VALTAHVAHTPQATLYRVELVREIAGQKIRTAVNLRPRNDAEARERAHAEVNMALEGPEFEVCRSARLG